ncbi:hypothetical protein C8R48DRAFT_748600 [Suillus tomentosus]|nr:hypothetical protein C8R48DRAFT_748600 [Suillus tomentosus]
MKIDFDDPSEGKNITIVDKEQLKQAVFAGVHHSSLYFFDVLLQALRLMRIPLSAMLFLWMLASAITRLSGMLYTVLSPICYLPLISRSAPCTPLGLQTSLQWVDFPRLMQAQSSTFEQLLDGTIGGSGISLEIHKAEFATADLSTLSNHMLADLLATFVKDAKKTARSLTRLSSKVGGAVDKAMAVNAYAMHTIQDMTNTPLPYSFMALVPFCAEVCLHNLDMLEEDLSAIHEVVLREDISITAERSELLGELWTKLGRNKRALRDYERRLSLLKDLRDYWKYARVHVLAALQTLNLMSEDMEDLRQRVVDPELSDRRIPLQVHIESIENGLQRLQEGRIRAKMREEDLMTRVLNAD